MRYWWVNQNQTCRAETRGCYMWSPKQNGARDQFYDDTAACQDAGAQDSRPSGVARVCGNR